METIVGAQLIDRSETPFRLTSLGEEIATAARAMQREVHAVERRVEAQDVDLSGWVHVSVGELLSHYVMAPAWVEFRARFPHTELDLRTSDGVSNLSANEADVAIRIARTPPDDVIARRICGFAVAAYASKRYLEAHDPIRGPKECVWLGWNDEEPYATDLKDSLFADVPVRWRFRRKSLQLEATKLGFGLSALPCLAADRIPELQRLSEPHTVGSVFVMRHMDHRSTPRIRNVVDFCAAQLEANASALEGQRTVT